MKARKFLFSIVLIISVLLVSCSGEKEENEIYGFYSNGVEIHVGDDTSEVIGKLGEWIRREESPSCADMGLDVIYVYPGFRIVSHEENRVGRIILIEITSDTLSTHRGVRVGDRVDKVISAYGEGYRTVGESVEYSGEGCILRFAVRDGRVVSIKYFDALSVYTS